MRLCLLPLLAASSIAGQAPDQLFRERRFAEARAASNAQLAANKNDASALYWLGRIADAEGKNGEAIEWYEKAVKREDGSALYHYWLGSALGEEAQAASKLRQPFLARRLKAEFERAVALDPKMIDSRQGLVDFYSMAPGFMGGSMDKAREQAAEITKLSAMRGHFAAARLADRQRDNAGVEREYVAAIAAAPDSAQAYFSLAAFYRRLSRWDDAFAAYEQLMKAKPDEVVAHLGWGAVSAQSGKSYERGERELRYFLANASPSVGNLNLAGAHFRLGQILEKTARKDQAKAEYAEALKINPQHADAKKALEGLK